MGNEASPWRKGVFGFVGALALGAALTYAPGCYHRRVTAFDADDGVQKYEELHNALLWGIISEPILLTPTAEDPKRRCDSNSLYEVRVTTNFGHVLVTVLTLGIWAPARVEWTCAARPAVTGGFGDVDVVPEDDEEGDDDEAGEAGD